MRVSSMWLHDVDTVAPQLAGAGGPLRRAGRVQGTPLAEDVQRGLGGIYRPPVRLPVEHEPAKAATMRRRMPDGCGKDI